jgi:hypothetical protein
MRERFKVPPAEIALVEDQLRAYTIVARPAAPPSVRPDPDDKWVLASALAGGAELLVTGDKALLTVGLSQPGCRSWIRGVVGTACAEPSAPWSHRGHNADVA